MVALLLGPTDKIASAMTERFSTLFPPASGDSSQLAQLPPTSASGPVGAKGAFVWVGSQIAAKFEATLEIPEAVEDESEPEPEVPKAPPSRPERLDQRDNAPAPVPPPPGPTSPEPPEPKPADEDDFFSMLSAQMEKASPSEPKHTSTPTLTRHLTP